MIHLVWRNAADATGEVALGRDATGFPMTADWRGWLSSPGVSDLTSIGQRITGQGSHICPGVTDGCGLRCRVSPANGIVSDRAILESRVGSSERDVPQLQKQIIAHIWVGFKDGPIDHRRRGAQGPIVIIVKIDSR
jgi:hypothetical protein